MIAVILAAAFADDSNFYPVLRVEPSADEACRVFAEGLHLCFRTGSDVVMRNALQDHTLEQVETLAVQTLAEGLTADRPQQMSVEGMTGQYWVSMEGDGLDIAGLFYPQKLAEIAGGNPVVAVPAKDIILFWLPGDADFDKVMGVGAQRIYDSATYPLSQKFYRFEDGHWKVWGQVRRGD